MHGGVAAYVLADLHPYGVSVALDPKLNRLALGFRLLFTNAAAQLKCGALSQLVLSIVAHVTLNM